jgi:hypothetical protein
MQPDAVPGSLFGRERELALIRGFLERAAGGPATLVLEGEPGIGKTTLWRAGVDAARAQAIRVLAARPAEAERELSFSALGDLLAPELGRLEALSPPRRRALEVALLLETDEVGHRTRWRSGWPRSTCCGCWPRRGRCWSRSTTRSGSTRRRVRRWCMRSGGSRMCRSGFWPRAARVPIRSRQVRRSAPSSMRSRSVRCTS